MKTNNVDGLREHMIEVLESLANKEISVEEALGSAKVCDSIVGTMKIQLEYSKLTEKKPNIQFIESCTLPQGRVIEEAKIIREIGME